MMQVFIVSKLCVNFEYFNCIIGIQIFSTNIPSLCDPVNGIIICAFSNSNTVGQI